jgi:hypothetical protein
MEVYIFMLNKIKTDVTQALHVIYDETNGPFGVDAYSMFLNLTVPGILYDRNTMIKITRSRKKDDLYYKLYIPDDDVPFLTVYGAWPIEAVSEIFVSTLKYYYAID